MKTKLLEIRDEGTFIPVLCVSMKIESVDEAYLAGRMGFNPHTHLIQLVWINHGLTEYDPWKWNDRTMKTAHIYITDNWYLLKDGDVVDVQYILGETEEPKQSEQFETHR